MFKEASNIKALKTRSHCRLPTQISSILVKAFIYLQGFLITGLAASLGSDLRRGHHSGFESTLSVTVLKFLIIWFLNLYFVIKVQWDNRGSAEGLVPYLTWGSASQRVSAILSAPHPCSMTSTICPAGVRAQLGKGWGQAHTLCSEPWQGPETVWLCTWPACIHPMPKGARH